MLNGYDGIENIIFYKRGRDAIWNAINLLNIKQGDAVLAPAYLCEAVIEPIKRQDIDIIFYRIDKSLSLDLKDLKAKLTPNTKAILLIHYFGFPQNSLNDIISICQVKNLYLIEDCAHALFSKFEQRSLGTFGDVAIFSFKKSLKDIQGGALVVNNKKRLNPCDKKVRNSDYTPWHISGFKSRNNLKKYLLRYKGARFIIDRFISYTDFFRLKPNSEIAKKALKLLNSVDVNSYISSRRDNFEFILDCVKNIKNVVPVFGELKDGICPLIFPLYIDNRDGLYRELLKNNIVPLIFWEFLPVRIARGNFSDSLYISKNILGLPIDDSINKHDLAKMMEVLKNNAN